MPEKSASKDPNIAKGMLSNPLLAPDENDLLANMSFSAMDDLTALKQGANPLMDTQAASNLMRRSTLPVSHAKQQTIDPQSQKEFMGHQQ